LRGRFHEIPTSAQQFLEETNHATTN